MIHESILGTIGNTPVVKVNHLAPQGVTIYVKCEAFNPLASVKDRLAIAIIEDGERTGELKPGQTVVEATSGNTGIADAMLGRALGFPVTICLPANASAERQGILRAFGAELVFTDPLEGTDGAIRKARAGHDDPVPVKAFRTELLAAMERLKVPRELASRYLNDGFSGGEKKRVEILQMAMLKPKIAVLDETDSGLDIDALKIVARGVNALVGPETGAVVITHYQRILNYVTPDFVHVFVDGRIVAEGGPELAHKLEAEGYEAFIPAGVTGGD